ncbi:Hint domain-containing protein [Ruegeria hyattellae]|uniref:Hint domain-containing protein n=1 Tax=Ruegeria hyattellae TaxID=3233337 RepID=UPI00355B205A
MIITDANAGDVVAVDGNIYIIDPSLTQDVTFTNAGGSDVNFEVRFDQSNPNSLKVDFDNDPGLNPQFTIADDVNIADIQIDAKNAASTSVSVGNNVELERYTGSDQGDDTIVAGDNFDLDGNLDLGEGVNSFTTGDFFNSDGSNVNIDGGDDGNTISIGANGQVRNIKLGDGEDSVTLGDGSDFNDLDTKDGEDTVTIGDGVTGNNIDLGDSADTLNIGVLGEDALGDVKGGKPDTGGPGVGDTLNTQTDPAVVDFAKKIDEFENINIVCLASGTLIETHEGPAQIEDLRVGDLVSTMDHGLQSILWIGRKKLTKTCLASQPKLRPVRITAGALGSGFPKRDLLVSRQHRMLVSSKIAMRMFSSQDILVAAIKLTELPGICIDETVESVEYFHLLFDRHEIIYAEEAPTESLYAGAEALKAISLDAREEILTLFPELQDETHAPEPALPMPACQLQKQLVARHVKNGKPLLEASPGVSDLMFCIGPGRTTSLRSTLDLKSAHQSPAFL